MRRPPTAIPALITPFDRRGVVDLGAHRHNVALLWERGIRGFLIAGSTGEGPYLEPGERRLLVAAAREAAPRAFLMCGLAAESLRTGRGQAEEASDGGADAVLALSPTTLVRGRDGLVAGYFTDVATASPLPVFLYSHPRLTAYEVPLPIISSLSTHDNVVGMKDSGGRPVRAAAIVAAAADGFVLYAGATPALTLSIAAGGHGAITASTNYAAELVIDVVAAARRSARSARDSQHRLTTLAQQVEAAGIGAIKAAAELRGLQAGPPRRPLRTVSAKARRAIGTALESGGLPPV
jgi:dihydrodipicolinate synthase/N-acetylneuraminate lyase